MQQDPHRSLTHVVIGIAKPGIAEVDAPDAAIGLANYEVSRFMSPTSQVAACVMPPCSSVPTA